MSAATIDRKNLKAPAADEITSVLTWAQLFAVRSAVLFFLLILVLFSGMSVVLATYKNRYALHELQQLRNEHNQLDVQWGQLLIEQSTFGLEDRIGRKAEEELGMKLPDWSGVIMVKYE
jgi:cell division protein FtsL